ncbi:MAG: helix-turn-helix domain-containing protein [Bacteroidales bacterium]|nr:helix-turn-helix domain-containing protein [Bacteroidales bacterium]
MRKTHTFEDRLKYMRMLEEGYSVNHISTHYGISHYLLDSLWRKYQKEGPSGLLKKQNIRSDGPFREAVLQDIENNCLTLSEAAIKYNVSVSRIQFWRRIVRASGFDALYETKHRGRPPKKMGRPKKKKPEEMTELERLRYENECLRAENALLKKVRALVEEREARLRGTGQKPSKN